MGILESLKKIIKVDKLTISPKLILNINYKSGNSVFNKDNIYINYTKLDSEKKEILKMLINENIANGGSIYEKDTFSRLNDLYEYNKKSNEDKALLELYRDLIPQQDLEILKAALYLRKKFVEKTDDTTKLKRDIIHNFGIRGKNIANLCTAGYFETIIKQLSYELDKKEFLEVYEKIVSTSLIALFVHSDMDVEQIKTDIFAKIEQCKKNGFKYVHIHGIGKRNIEAITRTIDIYESQFNYYKKYVIKKKNILIVELILE